MKKIKLILFIFVLTLLYSCCVSASEYYYDGTQHYHSENVKLFFENEQVYCDVPPLIVNNRTLVPARAFFEKLGSTVKWNEEFKRVIVSGSKFSVTMTIDSKTALVNGKEVSLDVPAKIIADSSGISRTMIPVRFVSTCLGFNVGWDGSTSSVYISSVKNEHTSESISGSVSDILVSSVGDTDTVKIITTAQASPSVMTLNNPSRLVLDFNKFTLTLPGSRLSKSGICFSDIRYADHAGEYARVVIDLSTEYTYNIFSNGNECIVTIKNNGSSSVIFPSEPNKPNVPEKEPQTPSSSNGEVLIVIDPGHGGSDPGAIGYKDGKEDARESNITLDISKKLDANLKSAGIKTVMTRTTDEFIGLAERAEFANERNATLFVCVHINSATVESAHGSSVYYYTSDNDAKTKEKFGITSKEFAQLIQNEILKSAGRYDRKIQNGSNLAVLRRTTMPAVLVECAFISNDEERELMKTDGFRQKLADGISQGVIKALKQMGKIK